MADESQLPRPRLPQRSGQRAPQRNATFIALIGVVGAAIGFAVLLAAVMTGFAPAALVVAVPIVLAVTLLFGGHYLLWGVWLDRMHASRGGQAPEQFWKRAAPQQAVLEDDAEDRHING